MLLVLVFLLIFFIKICIILVFFRCFLDFWLLLVLIAQVVWFIAVFCFVVMFVFYGVVIKCLIFLLAISTVSINDFYFCNFFVIFTIFCTIFLVFIIKNTKFFWCKFILRCISFWCVVFHLHRMVRKLLRILIFRKIVGRRFVLRCLLIVREEYYSQILLLFSLLVFHILCVWRLRLLVQCGMHHFVCIVCNRLGCLFLVASRCDGFLNRCRQFHYMGIVVLLRMCRLVVFRCKKVLLLWVVQMFWCVFSLFLLKKLCNYCCIVSCGCVCFLWMILLCVWSVSVIVNVMISDIIKNVTAGVNRTGTVGGKCTR